MSLSAPDMLETTLTMILNYIHKCFLSILPTVPWLYLLLQNHFLYNFRLHTHVQVQL